MWWQIDDDDDDDDDRLRSQVHGCMLSNDDIMKTMLRFRHLFVLLAQKMPRIDFTTCSYSLNINLPNIVRRPDKAPSDSPPPPHLSAVPWWRPTSP